MRKIYLVLLMLIMSSCNEKNWYTKTGVDITEIKKIYEFENFYGTDGEGYLVEIYKLANKDYEKLINSEIFNFPIKDDYKMNWKIYKWNKLKNYNSIDNIKKLLNSNLNKGINEGFIKSFNANLAKQDNLISFYYKGDENNPYNLSLYLLSIEEKKIYFFDFIQ